MRGMTFLCKSEIIPPPPSSSPLKKVYNVVKYGVPVIEIKIKLVGGGGSCDTHNDPHRNYATVTRYRYIKLRKFEVLDGIDTDLVLQHIIQ